MTAAKASIKDFDFLLEDDPQESGPAEVCSESQKQEKEKGKGRVSPVPEARQAEEEFLECDVCLDLIPLDSFVRSSDIGRRKMTVTDTVGPLRSR